MGVIARDMVVFLFGISAVAIIITCLSLLDFSTVEHYDYKFEHTYSIDEAGDVIEEAEVNGWEIFDISLTYCGEYLIIKRKLKNGRK